MANPGRMAFDLALMNLAYLSRLACAGIWLALASCASVNVRETIPLTEAPTQGPQTILVQPFEFEDDMIRVNRQGAELEAFKRDLQKEMTANLPRKCGDTSLRRRSCIPMLRRRREIPG